MVIMNNFCFGWMKLEKWLERFHGLAEYSRFIKLDKHFKDFVTNDSFLNSTSTRKHSPILFYPKNHVSPETVLQFFLEASSMNGYCKEVFLGCSELQIFCKHFQWLLNCGMYYPSLQNQFGWVCLLKVSMKRCCK